MVRLNHKVLRAAFTLLAVATAAACSDGAVTPIPTPTTLRLDLGTPKTDDGALVIAVHGPDVSNIAPTSPGYLAYSRNPGPQETRVIIIGDLKAGPVLTMSIAPGHRLAEYSATIRQVATRTDTVRTDLSGYRLTITVP